MEVSSVIYKYISTTIYMYASTTSQPHHSFCIFMSVLSPPMSPVRVSGDEATHICSTLESVCHTENIGKDAVRQLCSHVQADQHEEQVSI